MTADDTPSQSSSPRHSCTADGPGRTQVTGGFNAAAVLADGMRLREALGELPEPVFADLLENDDAYLLVVDLPGATAGAVEVTVDDDTLYIEARREKSFPSAFEYVSEERSLFLDVELPLPPDAAGLDGEGDIERGVLTIRLPKSNDGGGSEASPDDPRRYHIPVS